MRVEEESQGAGEEERGTKKVVPSEEEGRELKWSTTTWPLSSGSTSNSRAKSRQTSAEEGCRIRRREEEGWEERRRARS